MDAEIPGREQRQLARRGADVVGDQLLDASGLAFPGNVSKGLGDIAEIDACAGGDWTGGLARLAEPTDVTGGTGVVEADVKDWNVKSNG